ncbi:MAG TPA: hypothetical protein VK730_12770 [Solirubrobacteraceae bacterium]|jgi:hypothetical protein|nr:hypothetical protein [Solirubrobacteraceae bacterium]
MIELVKSPSTRVLSKGCFALWLVVSLVFAALLFAAGAQAQGTNVPDGAAETPIGEMATQSGAPPEEAPSVVEEAPPVAQEAPPVVEQAPPVTEEAPPATEQAPPVTEEAPSVVEQAPPAAEEAPPAAEQAPPVAEQAPTVVEEAPPVVEQAPPVVEEAPSVVKQAPPVAEEAPPVTEKKTVEQTAGEVAAEAGSEATQRSGEESQVPASASGLTRKDATGEVAPEISIAVTTSVAPATASEISMAPVQPQSSLTLRPQTISARSAGPMSCVGASITAGYAGGWLDISLASSLSNVPFTTADASSTAIAAGAPAGSLGDGSTIENHPSAPGSGFGSGGGGVSVAGGGSGSASSASSTLVDVLLQAAPRAMRRLRLAQPSLRTSFFVLIPERPD